MSSTSTAAVGFRSERGPVLISVMLSTGLVAIDSTVLATAVPSIVGELGGFHQFPWLFSAYLLGQAVTTPIYAKLSDVFGRKPILLLGIALFLLGSILCAAAWNMLALIVFRAVQGLGAGAVQPTAMTIVGDIYTVAERARVQGYLASVWAISSVVGPMLGGVFSQLGIWRGVFLINIPLCLIAAWMFHRHFHETITPRRRTVDSLGALLLALAMTSLVLAVLGGGQTWAWDSVPSISAFALGAVLLATFVLVERRAAEPILPLWVFSRRLLCATTDRRVRRRRHLDGTDLLRAHVSRGFAAGATHRRGPCAGRADDRLACDGSRGREVVSAMGIQEHCHRGRRAGDHRRGRCWWRWPTGRTSASSRWRAW